MARVQKTHNVPKVCIKVELHAYHVQHIVQIALQIAHATPV
jgi:hypothetical protein